MTVKIDRNKMLLTRHLSMSDMLVGWLLIIMIVCLSHPSSAMAQATHYTAHHVHISNHIAVASSHTAPWAQVFLIRCRARFSRDCGPSCWWRSPPQWLVAPPHASWLNRWVPHI